MVSKGVTIRILGGLELFGNKYFVGKMGEINKWPQGLVEIQPGVKTIKLSTSLVK